MMSSIAEMRERLGDRLTYRDDDYWIQVVTVDGECIELPYIYYDDLVKNKKYLFVIGEVVLANFLPDLPTRIVSSLPKEKMHIVAPLL